MFGESRINERSVPKVEGCCLCLDHSDDGDGSKDELENDESSYDPEARFLKREEEGLEVYSHLDRNLEEDDEGHECNHLRECLFDVANIAEIENCHFDGQVDDDEEEIEELPVASHSEHVHLIRANGEEEEGVEESIVEVVIDELLKDEVGVDWHIDHSRLMLGLLRSIWPHCEQRVEISVRVSNQR